MPISFGQTESWYLAFFFGAVMVAIRSWSRFDDPTYNTQNEYFALYKPRFSTSHARYNRAKIGYAIVILLIYVLVTLVPQIFTAILSAQANANIGDSVAVPLAAALAITSLQDVPVLNNFETAVRGFIHSLAEIPDGVRRTVAHMRRAEFSFQRYINSLRTGKVGHVPVNVADEDAFASLIQENDALQLWFKTGCLLYAASAESPEQSGIDALFSELYKGEFDNIEARHSAWAPAIAQLLGSKPAGSSPGIADSAADNAALLAGLKTIADRLFTYLACGLRSVAKQEGEVRTALGRFGFTVAGPTSPAFPIGQMIALSFLVILVSTIVTSLLTQLFIHSILDPLGDKWKLAYPVPREPILLYTWSLSTAAYYFAALCVSLAYRSHRILRGQWFDAHDMHRRRPIMRYPVPVIFGTCVAYLTLLLIAVLQGPGFHNESGAFRLPYELIPQTAPWIPLAAIMSFIGLWTVDTDWSASGFWKMASRSLAAGILMTIAGWATSYLAVGAGIGDYAAKANLQMDPTVQRATTLVNFLIAFLIGLFACLLCGVMQVVERNNQRARDISGKKYLARSSRGPVFEVQFEKSRRVQLVVWTRDQSGAKPGLAGSWQQFPEGMLVKWDDAGVRYPAGKYGFVTIEGGWINYTGFTDSSFSAPMLEAQLYS